MLNANEIKKLILGAVKALARPIIIIALIAIILVSLFWGVINGTLDKVMELVSDVSDNVKISGNNIEIDQDYLNQAEKKLEKFGISAKTLGFGDEEEYLERFLEAEIVTSYPYLGGDGLQGAVYFERAKSDGSTVQLQYMEYSEFYSKKDSGEDLTNYFTVDTNDWTVHIIKSDGNIEKINYKSMVSKFAMPFEFPISLALATQNPQFALAVVNLVKDSKIVITIAESKTTTTTTNTESYTRTVADEEGNVESQENVSAEPQVSTEEVYSTDIFLSRAQTWILNEVTDFKYEDVTETDDPVVTELISQSTTTADGKVVSITNRKNTKEVSRHYQRWVRGATRVIEKSSNFTNLILRDSTITNGQGLVEVAKRCHDAIAQSGRFSYGATSGGIPIDVNTDTTVDCSGYVSWVLYEAGYKDMAGGQHNTHNDSLGAYGKGKGWDVITNIDELKPGDICFWGGTLDGAEPYHVNIYVGEESGKKLYYDCGSQSAIDALDPIEYVANDFGYAFRPNDEIAKALSPETADDLKTKLQNYVDGIDNGTYAVSVRNLDSSSELVNINNNKVKSEGLIKLYIMATAYNEVKKGSVKEEDVSGDLERMITADNNTSANALLKTIGNGDAQKGINLVNDYASDNGYDKTNLETKLAQETTETPNDKTVTTVGNVSKLLEKIFNGKCVNKKYSDKMMNLLKNQLIIDIIPSTITEAETANKTGEQSGVVQDAAIISTENANYAVVISASDIVDTDMAKTKIKEIATMVNNYFIENGKIKDNSENYEEDNGVKYVLRGRKVCYKLSFLDVYECPLNNLIVGREMLFELLNKSDKTQNYVRLVKYLLYLLTGDDYGVTEFDFNEFLNGSFSNVSGLYGNTPQEKVWWALIDAGYSAEAAAGVLGNIEAESGFNEASIEGGSGAGFGLCQWTGGRRTQLESYAASKGVAPSDLDTQIEFLLAEITPGGGANGYAKYQLSSYNGYSASDWKNASTPEDAATAFCWTFERPGIPRMDVRTSAARRYYNQFKDAERPSGGNVTSIQAVLPNYPFSSSSGFGYRNGPFYGPNEFHQGTDIPAPAGTEIAALGSGIVKEMVTGYNGGRGNYIRIDHQNGYETLYQHCNGFAAGLSVGSHVSQGQIIAYVGSTGDSTGAHLHLEILVPAGQGEHSSYFTGYDVVNPETFDYTKFPG